MEDKQILIDQIQAMPLNPGDILIVRGKHDFAAKRNLCRGLHSNGIKNPLMFMDDLKEHRLEVITPAQLESAGWIRDKEFFTKIHELLSDYRDCGEGIFDTIKNLLKQVDEHSLTQTMVDDLHSWLDKKEAPRENEDGEKLSIRGRVEHCPIGGKTAELTQLQYFHKKVFELLDPHRELAESAFETIQKLIGNHEKTKELKGKPLTEKEFDEQVDKIVDDHHNQAEVTRRNNEQLYNQLQKNEKLWHVICYKCKKKFVSKTHPFLVFYCDPCREKRKPLTKQKIYQKSACEDCGTPFDTTDPLNMFCYPCKYKSNPRTKIAPKTDHEACRCGTPEFPHYHIEKARQ